MMKRAIILAAALLSSSAALAADASGNVALSLAARVGERSLLLNRQERNVLQLYLAGQPNAHFPAGKTIEVKADKVVCRISDVDITAKNCTLTFGGRTPSFGGREAQALDATLVQAGVPSEGAAGSIFEAVTSLDCVINPAEVKQKAGGGAKCTFTPGQ